MLVLLDLDPNVVKPGWTPLLITVALAAVMVLLFFSLRKQFRRIDVSQSQAQSPAQPTPPAQEQTAREQTAQQQTGTQPAPGPEEASPKV